MVVSQPGKSFCISMSVSGPGEEACIVMVWGEKKDRVGSVVPWETNRNGRLFKLSGRGDRK